jgi:hypothetical protein
MARWRPHRTPSASFDRALQYSRCRNPFCDDAIFRRDSFSNDSLVRLSSHRATTPRAFRLEERKTSQDLTSPVALRLPRRGSTPDADGGAAPKSRVSTSEPEPSDVHTR